MLKIATLEFYLNTDKVVNHVFSDTSSLLDSDVVISDPSQLHKYWQGAIKFNDGKYRLNSSKGSDDLLKLFAKREKEIQTLLSNGKVCISFLTPVSEVLAEQNGTRNYIWLNNYQWFGARKDLLKFLISGEGEQISLEQSNHPFAPFFNAFKNNLTYHAYLDDDVNDTTVTFLKNKAKKPVAFFMQLD